jgi:vacuolar-type H+-ATPase subunit H
MTEDLGNYPLGSENPPGQPSAAGVAREQASNVGQSVRDAGSQVAGTAAERAKDVVSEAQGQARDLLGQAQGQARDLLGQAQQQARDQARTQQQQAAGRLHGLADELSAMADNGGQDGWGTELARQASWRLHDAASWLEQHEPADLVQEVRGFARRRPGVFVAAAAMAGIAAGRLTRGAVAAQQDSEPETPDASGDGWAAQTATEPIMPARTDADAWAADAPAYRGIQP